MKHVILTAVAAVLMSLGSAAPAASRNYDCSKPGNANKAACKDAAKAASTAVAKPAPAAAVKAKPSATKVSSTTTTKTVTERNYDCSKAGNKNKAVCKSAATTSTKPVVKETTVASSTRHYDCSKPGNANKEQCKVSTTSQQTNAKPVAVPKSAPAPAPKPSVAAGKPAATTTAANDNNPAGATAQCKDGTYSHAKTHRGACSRHGGVAKWL
jgi:large subunit ribosomal protein L22e/Meckel syndrome type 1 protein